MKLGKFHSPYMPNDGHGPGVPLPEKLHRWLCTLSGGVWPVRIVIESISEMAHDEPLSYSGEDHNDYICVVAYEQDGSEFNFQTRHRWLGIKYDEVKDDRTQAGQ